MNNPSTLKSPPALKPRDTIGIVAPSSGLAGLFPHRAEQGARALERLGYSVVFAPHSREINGYVSASVESRVDDLHAMFKDPSIRSIVTTIGGNHANQLLKHLDYDLIAANPKVFTGYSDITVLHWAFARKAGLRTFYGPCLVSEFAEYPDMHV
jgi:muramoyltetrapeptide carboxypeptidase